MTQQSVPPSPPPTSSDLELMMRSVIGLLERKPAARTSRAHPEVRKVLERALDRLTALSSLAGVGSDPTLRDTRIGAIRREHAWLTTATPKNPPSEEQAWALVDELQTLWICTASTAAVADAVSRVTEPRAPKQLPDADKRDWLLGSHIEHQRARGRARARQSLRARYLRNAGFALTTLVVVGTVVAVVVGDDDGVVLLCGLAGAIGGTLAGARSIRDSRRLRDALFFQTWWWVQPAVGFAVGLFVYALLASSVIILPGSDSPEAMRQATSRIVYAFVGGFSEPWLLGILTRLGGAADKAAEPKPATPGG
ncbi:hypothetical protein FE697_017480 [Mumia zhuanghuii]|uniref:Integral membrane protein n=2 Tax=Mumia TaxID=1546255 RepID=A0ABW1QQU4_9ACTN|nr:MULTISPECIES: hypothetical protein [Mumia]KAA1420728.1 hypothetical protein FE697_017480 [Mumia zhuanghuii]